MCGRVGQLPVHQKALEGINVGIVPYYYALLHMIFLIKRWTCLSSGLAGIFAMVRYDGGQIELMDIKT